MFPRAGIRALHKIEGTRRPLSCGEGAACGCEQNQNQLHWADGPRLSRQAQSGAAARRRAWRRRARHAPGRAAAGHRRRRLGQDQHAGAPRRPSDRQRRRSAPHPAADLLAPRRRRDDAPRRAHRAQRARRQAGVDDRRAGLGRHLPRHRRAAAARVRRADRPRPGLHHPRPRGLRRPDEPRPARARLLEDGERAFPTKGTCLAIYSRCVNAEMPLEDVLHASFPWCAAWAEELRELFAAYVEAKQRQNVLDYDDLLLYWAQMVAEPALAEDIGGRFDHVLVDEYQDTNRLQASILLALKPDGARPDRRRRRRAVDLFLPRRDRAQHPRLPRALRPAGRDRHARPQLPLDAADPRRRQRASSTWPPSASPRTCGPTATPPSARGSSPCATRPTRRATSSSACWRTARPASR